MVDLDFIDMVIDYFVTNYGFHNFTFYTKFLRVVFNFYDVYIELSQPILQINMIFFKLMLT